MNAVPTCMYVYHMHVSACGSQKRLSHSGTGVNDCEPPCRCQEMNLGILKEQLMLSTAGISLQSLTKIYQITCIYLLIHLCACAHICICMPGMFLGTQCRGQKTTSRAHFLIPPFVCEWVFNESNKGQVCFFIFSLLKGQIVARTMFQM